ncbi:unnamed protein product [Echinostoma caproni]|uniref:USP domain-containing protein n=1 Tax=Echinostoma caproni TaxID=27848 RepID=A0A183AD94_9TREM|nr:unnamed protein product [Echinostoma caproni]
MSCLLRCRFLFPGSCADVEDSDGTERRNTTSPVRPDSPENKSRWNSSTSNATGPNETTVPAFLVEQLEQLNLDESNDTEDSEESLLTRASRLAQIPLQASSLSQLGVNHGDSVCDLYSCLSLFTAPEHLDGTNRIVCPQCNKHPNGRGDQASTDDTKSQNQVLTDAIRRDLVLQPPALLTIHLKRFQQIGVHIRKSQKRVIFPLLLDLSPFCSALYLSQSRSVQYRLYGVVEHLGHMACGHYVAYVAVQTNPDLKEPDSQTLNGNSSAEFIKRFVGQLDIAPKWPMTTHDLLQRWRRCDRNRLSESIEETKSLVGDMLGSSGLHGEPSAEPTHLPSQAASEHDSANSEETTDTRTWFRCSDEHIDQVPLMKVLQCQAYVLFYERIR